MGRPPGRLLALSLLALLGAGAGPALATLATPGGAPPATRLALPTGHAGWVGPGEPDAAWSPHFPGADTIRDALYRPVDGPAGVRLLVVHYRREAQGRELINAQNRLFDRSWRRQGGVSSRRVTGPGGARLRFRERRLEGPDGRQRLVWSWYEIGGRRVVDPAPAKVWAAVKRLLGGPADTTLVALATDYRYGPGTARDRLRAFLEAHGSLARARSVIRLAEGDRQ